MQDRSLHVPSEHALPLRDAAVVALAPTGRPRRYHSTLVSRAVIEARTD